MLFLLFKFHWLPDLLSYISRTRLPVPQTMLLYLEQQASQTKDIK